MYKKINHISQINVLNSKFNHFGQSINNNANQGSIYYFVSQVKLYEKQYKRLGFTGDFFIKAGTLADNLSNIGLKDFAGILYSVLTKIPDISVEQKEILLKRAIGNARAQNDTVHALARTIDLKQIYKQNKMRNKYNKILYKEEKLLESIISNYDKKSNTFRSVSKGINNINVYLFRLATTKFDIAKIDLFHKPKDTIKRLSEAKIIFKQLGRQKEFDFAESLSSKIKI